MIRRSDIRIVKKPTGPEVDLQRQAVQKLVANVVDDAHWQQILAAAESDASREELERVVGPLLKFRRAAPCTTPDCDSGEQGLWQPVLVVSSPLAPDDRSWVSIELRLCERCKAEATTQDFLTDGIWAQILDAWTHHQWPPVRARTTLAWERVH